MPKAAHASRHSCHSLILPYYPFEFAFLHTKPHAVVRFGKPWRFQYPLGRKEAHMDNKPVSVTENVIGDTLYIIESAISDTAKETAYDKLKHMILGEVESQKMKLAS